MKKVFVNGLLVVSSLFFIFLALEIGIRIYTSNYRFVNILENHHRVTLARYPTRYDELLGWVSRLGVSRKAGSANRISILENSIRSNGVDSLMQDPAGQRPVLAVGDSYTFGYEVADDESWPAILESLIDRRVINGGVFAYGMDQSLIRARQLIDIYEPDTLIYSFIPQDIWRSQISSRSGVSKPYYDIYNGALVLKNSPVPRPSLTDHGNPGMRRMLGYSAFLDYFMLNYGYGMWWLRGDQWEDKQVHDDQTGEKIACLIVEELEEIARSKGIDVYLLAQYEKQINSPLVKKSKRALKCADPQWITVIDLYEPLLEVKKHDKKEYRNLFTKGKRSHMTYLGNKFVAMKIKETIDESKSD